MGAARALALADDLELLHARLAQVEGEGVHLPRSASQIVGLPPEVRLEWRACSTPTLHHNDFLHNIGFKGWAAQAPFV